MKRWEYTMACFDISTKETGKSGTNLYNLSEKTGKPLINVNGVTPLSYINYLGEQGWELVSQTNTSPDQVLFTFKRQKGV